MKRCMILLALGLTAVVPHVVADDALGETIQANGSCLAEQEAAGSAFDRGQKMADDLVDGANAAINAAKEKRGSLSKCLGNLASLDFGVALGVQMPNVMDIIKRLGDRACQFTATEINRGLSDVERQMRVGGDWWNASANLGNGSLIEINTRDTSRYASDCIWRKLNGDPAC